MLHCLNTSANLGGGATVSDMTVLERQRARRKWQHEHEHEQEQDYHGYFCGNGFSSSHQIMMVNGCDSALDEVVVNTKKRKAMNSKVVVVAEECDDDNKDKRIKVSAEEEEEESKITEQTKGHKTTKFNKNNRENSAQTSKENSKVSENQNQKLDYIHVRARRGQATDSHSLAERVRREKISERMKYLQDLVPGCNKIAGKAGMLDEIINYVQSLQRQVEFLSMKLAAVNPRLDFNIDELFAKEVFPQNFPSIGMQSDMANPSYLNFNSSQQLVSSLSYCGGIINNIGLMPPDIDIRRNINAPASLPEMFVDSSCFTHILPSSTLEGDFQNLHNVIFDQGRSTSFPSQPFTGLIEASNLKMEM